MFKYLLLLSVCLVSCNSSTKTTSSYESNWNTHMNPALTVAKAEKKQLLILFSGSDWCPPCKKANETIFSKEAFYIATSEKYVLVKLDNKRTSSASIKGYIGTIAVKYQVTSVPTVIIADSTGKKLRSVNPLSVEFKKLIGF